MLQIYSPGWAGYAYANYDITDRIEGLVICTTLNSY